MFYIFLQEHKKKGVEHDKPSDGSKQVRFSNIFSSLTYVMLLCHIARGKLQLKARPGAIIPTDPCTSNGMFEGLPYVVFIIISFSIGAI